MTDEEYETHVRQMMLLGSIIREIPVEAVLARLDRATLMGPVLDPTAYRAASGRLEVLKKVARAALAFQQNLPSREECTEADRQARAYARKRD